MAIPSSGIESAPKPPAASPSLSHFPIDPNFAQSHSIKVCVRLKPLDEPSNTVQNDQSSKQRKSTSEPKKRAWSIQRSGAMDTLTQNGVIRKTDGRSVFNFDQIFDEETKTPLLYKSIARPMVKSVLSGKHSTIFAYGSTGTGKTFTMQGEGKAASGQAGIIQLVASDLFRFMRQGPASKRDFVVKVSYIEIYNEKLRDLLSDDIENTRVGEEIAIRSDSNGDVAVNCIRRDVSNVDQVLELLIQGNKKRMVAETDKNAHSSRSHAIFRLTVESKSKNMSASDTAGELIRLSDFNLVDLAGAESIRSSGGSVVRQREGISINQSLLALSTVVYNLSLPEKKRPKFINYRDSKLTRILQPHLSGNSEMAIVCCVSSAKASIEETRSTLRFAYRAKLVQMKPRINEVADDGALIRRLQMELNQAKKELTHLRALQEEKDDGFGLDYADDGPSKVPFGSRLTSNEERNEGVTETKPPVARGQPPSSSGPSRKYVMPKQQTIPLNKMDRTFQKFVGIDDEEDDISTEERGLSSTDEIVGPAEALDESSGSDERLAASAAFREEYRESKGGAFVGGSPARQTRATSEHAMDQTGPTAVMGDSSFGDISIQNGRSSTSVPESFHVEASTGRVEAIEQSWELRDTVSWDTAHNRGTVHNVLDSHEAPEEITIIRDFHPTMETEVSLADQLADTVARATFLASKLESSDDLIEALFRDLEKSRVCIHRLVTRNARLASKLNVRSSAATIGELHDLEGLAEHIWLLKGSMYVGLFFFVAGGYEMFVAAVVFVWLVLEYNVPGTMESDEALRGRVVGVLENAENDTL